MLTIWFCCNLSSTDTVVTERVSAVVGVRNGTHLSAEKSKRGIANATCQNKIDRNFGFCAKINCFTSIYCKVTSIHNVFWLITIIIVSVRRKCLPEYLFCSIKRRTNLVISRLIYSSVFFNLVSTVIDCVRLFNYRLPRMRCCPSATQCCIAIAAINSLYVKFVISASSCDLGLV